MARVRRKRTKNQASQTSGPSSTQVGLHLDDGTVTTPVTLAMIQALIPLGLRAVEEALQAEVAALAGARYAHGDGSRASCAGGPKRARFTSPTRSCRSRCRRSAISRPATTSRSRPIILRLVRELRPLNESAARSLEEGLEETLTLHRLGVFPELGISFKTTNRIESVMARVEACTAKVDRWRTSDQKPRWCAAALGAMERQFRRVKGCTHLPLLQRALQANMPTSRDAAA